MLPPPGRAQAPAVAGFEARKPKVRKWSGKVIASRLREREELCGDLDANGVKTNVLGAGVAAARTKEAGCRAEGANLDRLAEDVSLAIGHDRPHRGCSLNSVLTRKV
jgi:hypothetical protein